VTQLVSAETSTQAEELSRAKTHASDKRNIPQYGCKKWEICPIIEIASFFDESKPCSDASIFDTTIILSIF
jgi:hypothetical protein